MQKSSGLDNQSGSFKAHHEEDYTEFANWLVPKLPMPCVVLISGQLGAGKTTLCGYIAKALGVTSTLTSPSFNLANSYGFERNKQKVSLHHLDLYRLKPDEDQSDILSFLIEESQYIALIEWPQRLNIDFSLVSVPLISLKLSVTEPCRVIDYSFHDFTTNN